MFLVQAFWLLRQVLLNVYFWLTTRSIPQDLFYCHLLRCTVFLFVHVLECLGYALSYVSVPITLGAGQRAGQACSAHATALGGLCGAGGSGALSGSGRRLSVGGRWVAVRRVVSDQGG